VLQAIEEIRFVLAVLVHRPGPRVLVQTGQLAAVRPGHVTALPSRVQPLYLGICGHHHQTFVSHKHDLIYLFILLFVYATNSSAPTTHTDAYISYSIMLLQSYFTMFNNKQFYIKKINTLTLDIQCKMHVKLNTKDDNFKNKNKEGLVLAICKGCFFIWRFVKFVVLLVVRVE